MNGAFWLGYFTVPLLLLSFLVLWGAYSAASWLWNKLHIAWCAKVTLAKNKARPPFLEGTEGPPVKVEYLDAANVIRNALLESPKLYSMQGLGWHILLVRDSKGEK
jgi:hypothetical protein